MIVWLVRRTNVLHALDQSKAELMYPSKVDAHVNMALMKVVLTPLLVKVNVVME
jgi:hypothetical protein